MTRFLLPFFAVLAATAAAGPLTAGRAPAQSARLIRAKGGSATTEKAVASALDWLAHHQTPEGYWDADGFDGTPGCDCDGKGGGWHGARVTCPFDREVTGLAALAYLGAGQTHRSGPHAKVVARALAWLARPAGRTTLFATAFSVRALAEAYDMTGDASLRPPVERGIALLVSARLPDGGWRYWPGVAMASGVPTTTAVVCALRVAEEAGFEVDGAYKPAVLHWLDRLEDRATGRVAYTLDAARLGYTPTTTNAASALLCRLWLGAGTSDAAVRRERKAVMRRKPRWSIRFKRLEVKGVVRTVQIGYLQHYYWQHASEALARVGGGTWSAWNGALKKALLGHQRRSGHAQGSWDPVGTYGKVGGRVFSTALCALCLESAYRYPTSR